MRDSQTVNEVSARQPTYSKCITGRDVSLTCDKVPIEHVGIEGLIGMPFAVNFDDQSMNILLIKPEGYEVSRSATPRNYNLVSPYDEMLGVLAVYNRQLRGERQGEDFPEELVLPRVKA